jgi:hypothetical protein
MMAGMTTVPLIEEGDQMRPSLLPVLDAGEGAVGGVLVPMTGTTFRLRR